MLNYQLKVLPLLIIQPMGKVQYVIKHFTFLQISVIVTIFQIREVRTSANPAYEMVVLNQHDNNTADYEIV